MNKCKLCGVESDAIVDKTKGICVFCERDGLFNTIEILRADINALNCEEYSAFARQAMGAFKFSEANLIQLQRGERPDHNLAARTCFDAADAMMAELKRRVKREKQPWED